MNQWIDTKTFAAKIFRSDRQARDIIKARIYKGVPLVLQQGKSTRGGKPPYLVLWDTESNQPAIGDDHVLPIQKTAQTETDVQHQHLCGAEETRRPVDSFGNDAHTAGRDTSALPTDFQSLEVASSTILADKEVSTFLGDKDNVISLVRPAFTLVQDVAQSTSACASVHINLPASQTVCDSEIGVNENPVLATKTQAAAVASQNLSVKRPLSFKELAETAENNVQKRANARIDAVLDKILPENNDELNADKTVSRLLQSSEPLGVIDGKSLSINLGDVTQTNQAKTLSPINQDFYPESFDCQMHYVLRLIENQKLGKVCRCTALTAYFTTVYIAENLRAEWESLTNNVQRTEFAVKHKLVGTIPARLKAEGNPKSLTGRKSTVPPEAVEWIIKKVHEWADDEAQVLTATRRRTDFLLKTLLQKHTGIALSEKQVFTIVKNHNLRPLMDKPQGTAGKKVGKKKGTYPRLPVNSLWLMDGCVPELLYIRGPDGRYTKITCIGIEDVGSRVLLGFREYYSETAESAVDLDKQVFIQNQFKKGESGSPIVVTKRPDKGAGFMSQGAACAFALNKVYSTVHHFLIDFREANAGSPTEKAHLESAWKSVHSTYVGLVQDHFTLLGKVDKTPIINNHKRGIEMSALYLDITLEELRASGIGEEFRKLMNGRKRTFTEDNKTIDFVPDHRWARYLSGTTKVEHKWARFAEELDEKAPIAQPDPSTLFQLDEQALEMLNCFGYAKNKATVTPDMTIQYKVGYNVPRDLGFSITRSTPVRVSEMRDGTGRLAIFTAKEKKTKTKHDFGAEFLGFATVKEIGGNAEKAKHIRAKKDLKMAEVLQISKQESMYSLILKEIEPYLTGFGSEAEVKGLNLLVEMKLTPELAKLWIEEICLDKETAVVTEIAFAKFSLEARKRLQNVLVIPQQKRNLR